MRYTLILYVLVSVIAVGCNNAPSTDKIISEKYIINVAKNKTLSFDDITDSIRIIRVGNDKPLISLVTEVIASKSDFFVYDAKANIVVKINGNGDYLLTLGKIGQGPGEYVRVVRLEYDPNENEIIIFDKQQKLIFYNAASGVFKKEIKIPITQSTSFVSFGDKTYFFKGRFMAGKNPGNQIGILDKNFKFIGEDLPFEKGTGSAFGPAFPLQKTDSSLYCMPIFDQTIYKIIGNKFQAAYKFDFGKYNIPVDKILSDKKYTNAQDWLINSDKQDFVMFLNYLITSEHILITFSLHGENKLVVCNRVNNSSVIVSKIVDFPMLVGNQPVGSIGKSVIFAMNDDEFTSLRAYPPKIKKLLPNIVSGKNQLLLLVKWKP